MDRYQEYIKFIKNQMEYFDAKSIKAKKKYERYSIIALIANAIIPVLATTSKTSFPYNMIIAVLSSIAAIANGLAITDDVSKDWKHYRNCYTDLETVLRAYTNQVGDYRDLNEEDAFNLLYNQCESVLGNDRKSWAENTSKEKKEAI